MCLSRLQPLQHILGADKEVKPQGKYSSSWLARCILIKSMHANGISKLIAGDASPDVLGDASPDCKQHVKHFGKGHKTVYAMLNSIGYDGPPELFSMYCCLFSESTVIAKFAQFDSLSTFENCAKLGRSTRSHMDMHRILQCC